MCPPATRSCPLGRKAKPEQKMFAPAWVTAVLVFVDGSQSVGLSPWLNEGHHNTFPVGSRLAWTALYGQVITGENCPTVALFWALADETAMNCATTKQRSATNGTFSRSEEHEQDFSVHSKKATPAPKSKVLSRNILSIYILMS